MRRSIAVVGQKGGTSKSTISRALTVELANRGEMVVLADLDVKQQTVTVWRAQRTTHGHKPEIKVVNAKEVRGEKKLDVPAAATFVIYDFPGDTDAFTAGIAKAVNLVIIPTGPSRDDLDPTVKLVYELEMIGIPRERIVVVLTGLLNAESEVPRATNYLKTADPPIEPLKHYLRQMQSYRTANDNGLAVTEVRADLGKEAKDLVNEILNFFEEPASAGAVDYTKLDWSWK